MLGAALRLAGAAFMKAPITTSLVAVPSFLAGKDYIQGMPQRTAKEIINDRLANDPDNFGEFESDDANALQKLILRFGGDANSLDNLDDQFKKKRKTQIEQNLGKQIGLLETTADPVLMAQATVGLGESESKARGRMNALMPQVEEVNTKRRDDAKFGSKESVRERDQQDLQMQMLINSNERQIQETIDSRVGNQRLQEMQLLQMRENQADKMDLYRQQMTQKSADDRYRMTASLLSGLGTLGAAFAL